MPPTASFALRGTAMELTSKPWRSDTPSAACVTVKASAFVSWKKTTKRRPSAAHAAASPDDASSVCTSPCPCGLVSMTKALPASSAMCASLSTSAATFSCLTSVTWPGAMPKLPLASSSATVRACVSSDVMMTSGTRRGLAPAPAMALDSACAQAGEGLGRGGIRVAGRGEAGERRLRLHSLTVMASICSM